MTDYILTKGAPQFLGKGVPERNLGAAFRRPFPGPGIVQAYHEFGAGVFSLSGKVLKICGPGLGCFRFSRAPEIPDFKTALGGTRGPAAVLVPDFSLFSGQVPDGPFRDRPREGVRESLFPVPGGKFRLFPLFPAFGPVYCRAGQALNPFFPRKILFLNGKGEVFGFRRTVKGSKGSRVNPFRGVRPFSGGFTGKGFRR
jgi:hypothetical protein